MSNYFGKIYGLSIDEYGALSMEISRFCRAGSDTGKHRHGFQLTFAPYTSSYINLDRNGVELLIRKLQESLE